MNWHLSGNALGSRKRAQALSAAVVLMLVPAVLAGCTGSGSSRNQAQEEAQAEQASHAAECPGDPQGKFAYKQAAPINAKSGAYEIDTDMAVSALAGSGNWLAVGGPDSQWLSGGFVPAHLERLAQDTAKPLASVTLDAQAVGTVDTTASDPKTAYAKIDQITVGPQRIYALWTQYADKKIAQQRLLALDRCSLALMASVDLKWAQLWANTQLTYDTATNTVWLPSTKAINHYDATTLALITPGPESSDLPGSQGYARCLTAIDGIVWASTGQNGGTVIKIDAKAGTTTNVPALSLSHNDYGCVQHAGKQVYVAMDKQLVTANPDGSAGTAWPLRSARVAGVANGETWVKSGDGLHGLTSGATLAGPVSELDITTTTSNVWLTTVDYQLYVYGITS